MLKKWSKYASLAAAIAMVSACASRGSRSEPEDTSNIGPCPVAAVVDDAVRQVVFAGEPALENVAYSAEVIRVTTNCRYWGERPIVASIDIDFAFGRGPAGALPTHEFEYFIAITRTDLLVLEKQTFPVRVRFRGGDERRLRVRVDEITIPRVRETISGTNFEILVGLQLTPDQLAFAREGQSLRFPELNDR